MSDAAGEGEADQRQRLVANGSCASALVPLVVAEPRTEDARGLWRDDQTDAAQLGAALLIRDELGAPPAFVCLDSRLAIAAEREGLATVPGP